MEEVVKFTIPLNPITKKNHQQIRKNRRTGRMFVAQSDAYMRYQGGCGYFIKGRGMLIDYPVEVTTVFYMQTRHVVDLPNLIAAIHDILTAYEVIKDDNCRIIQSVDGSRVEYDKENPRTEVIIKRM